MVDFGIGQSELAWGSTYISAADVQSITAGLGAINGTRMRFIAMWSNIVPSKGTYHWTDIDLAVSACLNNNIIPHFCLSEPKPTWGVSAVDYGNFAGALVQHYGVDGFTYNGQTYGPLPTGELSIECWNEPNDAGFWYPIRPADYTEYLKAAYVAAHAARNDVIVVSAGLEGAIGTGSGLTMDALTYVQGIYAAGGQGFFDALGLHPYSKDEDFNPLPPSDTGQAFVRETAIRAYMDGQGDTTVPIWWTEWGFSTAEVTFAQQLTYYETQWGMWLERVAPGRWAHAIAYDFHDTHNKPTAKESSWGIVENDYTPKPAYTSFWSTLNTGSVAAVFSGYGTLGAATKPTIAAPFSGQGALSAATSSRQHTTAAFTGSGQLTAPIFGRPYGPFAGEGTLEADILQVQSAGAAFTGSGALTAGVDTAHHLSAGFTGSGQLTAIPAFQADYSWLFSGSTVPSGEFTAFGQGYTVASGIAENGEPSTNGTYYSGAIYDLAQFTADHSASVTRAAGGLTGETSDMPIVRSDAAGANWVGATARWGGSNSVQILVNLSGVVSQVASSTEKYSTTGSVLQLIAQGNVYTVWIDGVQTGASWTDVSGMYTGAGNLHSGFGFQHVRSAGVNYDAPGLTFWQGQDDYPTMVTPNPNAQFSGSGTLSAVLQANIPAAFTGSGALSAVVNSAGGSHSGLFTGSGSLSATAEQSFSLTAPFTGSGALATAVGQLNAVFSGAGSLSAVVSNPVVWLSSGVGNATSSVGTGGTLSTSWSHTQAVSGANVVAVVAAEYFFDTGTVTPTVTYGGIPMTLASSVVTVTLFGTALFYLFNPPNGTQTVTLTLTGFTQKYLAQGESTVYGNAGGVSSVTTLASSSSLTPSMTIPSTAASVVVAAFDRIRSAASTSITSETGTSRYYNGQLITPAGSVAQEYIYLSLQDTPGSASTTIGVTAPTGTSRGVGFSIDPPVSMIPMVPAAFMGSGALSGTAVATHAAAFTGSGTLSATPIAVFSRTAGFTGSGTVSATAIETFSASAGYTGSGTLSATPEESHNATAGFTGSGALSATIGEGALFTGSGTLSASAIESYSATAAFTGSGTLSATANLPGSINAGFTGSGALSATPLASFSDPASFTGSGALSAIASFGALFTGSGTLSANVNEGALFSGSGTLSASVLESFSLNSAFTGSGTLSATSTLTESFTFSGSTKPSGIIDSSSNGTVSLTTSIVVSGNLIEGTSTPTTNGTWYGVALWPDPSVTVLQTCSVIVGNQHVTLTNPASGVAVGFDSSGTNGVIAVMATGTTTGAQIITKVGSTWTVRTSTATSAATGDVLKLVTTVSTGIYTYTLYQNGTSIISWTDSGSVITPAKYWGAGFLHIRTGGMEQSSHGVSNVTVTTS